MRAWELRALTVWMTSGCGADDVRGGVRRWWRRWCGVDEGGRGCRREIERKHQREKNMRKRSGEGWRLRGK